jgi:hypothetical protein
MNILKPFNHQATPNPTRNLQISRRKVIGLAASALALSCTKGWAVAGVSTEQPSGALEDNEIFILVDGWVVPARYFRT